MRMRRWIFDRFPSSLSYMVYCHECGAELVEGSLYCNACGTKQEEHREVPTRERTSTDTFSDSRWLAALVGSVAGFVAALVMGSIFVPLYVFGILLGGAVAGYLYASDETTGVTVGAVSGLFATAPIALLLFIVSVIGFSGFALGIIGEVAPEALGGAGFLMIGVITLLVVVLSTLTNLLFGALGGVIGRALLAEA